MHVTLTSLVELNNIGASRTDSGSAEAPFAAVLDSAERHEADRTETSNEPAAEPSTEEVRESDDVEEPEREAEPEASSDEDPANEADQQRESDADEDREAPRDERELEQEGERTVAVPGQADPESLASRTDLSKTIATAVAEDTITEFAKSQSGQNSGGESLLDQSKLGQSTNGAQAPTAEFAAAPDSQQAATATGEATQQIKGSGPVKAAGAPSFVDPRTVHITETARASIFKQIAVRITGETGEMRVRLDPPELGHLDLQMFVDKSGAMRLNVIAERSDIAQAIERHLAELRATLAEHGVTVTEANIQSGTSGNPGHFEGEGPGSNANDGDHDDAPLATRDVQFINGDGLNLLV